jgi:hypothetical protein
MTQASYNRIEIRQLRFMDGAVPKILADGLGELIRMTHNCIRQPFESLGPSFDGKGTLFQPGAALPAQTGLQPVPRRVGNCIVHGLRMLRLNHDQDMVAPGAFST